MPSKATDDIEGEIYPLALKKAQESQGRKKENYSQEWFSIIFSVLTKSEIRMLSSKEKQQQQQKPSILFSQHFKNYL